MLRLSLITAISVVALSASALAKPMSDYSRAELWFNAQSESERLAIQKDLAWVGTYDQVADGLFGNNTFRAIMAWEEISSKTRDGLLKPWERAQLVQAGDKARAAAGAEFTRDPNGVVEVMIPLGLLASPKQNKGVLIWEAKDGRFSVELGTFTYDGGSFASTYEVIANSSDLGDITYRTFRPGYFVVTAENAESKMYLRAMDVGGSFAALTVHWLKGSDNDIRKLVVAVSNSLSILNGSVVGTERGSIGSAPPTPPAGQEDKIEKKDIPPVQAEIQTGTGFFITPNGHLLTNAHVVEGCKDALIRFDDSRMSPAQIIATDAQVDLALLQSGVNNTSFAQFSSVPLALGTDIELFGFPLLDVLSSTGNYVTGSVSALAGPNNDASLIQISAPVQSGNSGGAVLDRSAQVVAVVRAKMNIIPDKRGVEVVQQANFAINGDMTKAFARKNGVQIVEGGAAAPLENAEIAQRAKAFSAVVFCQPRL